MDQDLEDLTNASYHTLICKKKEYVENLEFDKAETITEILNQRKIENCSQSLEDAQNEMKDKINDLYNSYKINCEETKKKFENEEFQFRKEIDFSYQDIQARHIDELIRLEKAHSLEILKAKSRPSAKQIMLVTLAKKNAMQDRYKQAKQLTMDGEKAFCEEQKLRKQKIEEKYNVIRGQFFERQRKEIFILRDKLKSYLEQNSKKLNSQIESHLKQFKLSCLLLHRKSVESLISKFHLIETKNFLNKSITQTFYNELLAVSGIDFNPLSSSPKISKSKSPAISPNRTETL